jgi:hypothetical protein
MRFSMIWRYHFVHFLPACTSLVAVSFLPGLTPALASDLSISKYSAHQTRAGKPPTWTRFPGASVGSA